MDFFGLDLNYKTSWPTPEQWQELQPGWARFKHFSMDETKAILPSIPQWTGVCLLVDGETDTVGGDLSGWNQTIEAIRDEIGPSIDIIESLNEPDLLGVSAETAVRCATIAKEILSGIGTRVILGGVAGPTWRDYVTQCVQLGILDGYALHPYGQNPDDFTIQGGGFGTIKECVTWMHNVTNTPIYLTEMGCKIRDGGGANGVAQYLTAAVDTLANFGRDILPFGCWFCLDDAMDSPGESGDDAFGLTNAEEKRPAYAAFCEAANRYPKG